MEVLSAHKAPSRRVPARRRQAVLHGVACAAAMALCASMPLARVVAQNRTGSEPIPREKVIAAQVLRIASFVQWPEDTDAGTDETVIGVAASKRTFDMFKETLDGKTLDQRRVRVKEAATAEDLSGCAIVFIEGGAGEEFEEAVPALAESPVLTFGDAEHFLDRGGIVRFFEADRNIRFELNTAAADRAGLRFSATLLAYAQQSGKKPRASGRQ